ncbi:MAG TPA: dTDP-4-dehydrorhamnose 3,5-epimerase [Xanthobacteraceae bacterium]|nr:dTDP-4-dehydrorhamnose 3,5-epimerase [Xanthobacteraceae bacterium]
MDVRELSLPGLKLLKPRRFADSRGYFSETYNERTFAQAGITIRFVQDNQSFSARVGTVRALHFQLPPAPQSKLVRVLTGSIFDVGVDLRVGSPTYGRWEGITISAEGGEQFLVPQGFAHGFCSLEPNTVVAYKVDAFYAPAADSGLIWSDPDLAIDWPVGPQQAMLSEKDQKLGRFRDFKSPFSYNRP